MRVVFMGTPAFAGATLDALHRRGDEISLVFTQPDRPAGRGRKLTPPPVKARALALGLPVFQPRRVKEPESLERIQAIAPEVIVVVGYGQIIPDTIFNFPKYGCVNVHASLLPKYRGAAPDQLGRIKWRNRDWRDDHAHRQTPRRGRHAFEARSFYRPR